MLAQSLRPRPRRFAAVLSTLCILVGTAAAQEEVTLDVPYVQTPQEVVDKMLEMGMVTEKDYVIDLGSGDGRTPITAATRYKARGFGVDIDPKRVAEANENAKKAGVTDRVSFRQQDLFKTSIGEASVLTMYLLQRVNLELRPRILKELKPGSRVVSHAFDMGDWLPDQHEMMGYRHLYMWIVPANVEGRWRIREGRQTYDVTLTQKYQKVSGTVLVDSKQRPLENVVLRGEEISFVINTRKGRVQFVGRVSGNAIKSQSGIRRAGEWRATRS